MTTPDTELRNLVRDAIFDEDYALSGLMSNEVLDAAIAVVLEEAARVAENEGVTPYSNIYSDFYKQNQRVAAAIRALGTEKD